jgi:glycosyltransferase involved in cell wall biosynthesis
MPYSPYPLVFGGAVREYYILKSLAETNLVTLVTFGGPNEDLLIIRNLADILDEIRVVPKGFVRQNHRLIQLYALFTSHSYEYMESNTFRMQMQLDELFKNQKYDIIQTEFPTMGDYIIPSDALKILNEHNVEYDLYYQMSKFDQSRIRRWYYQIEYVKKKKEELDICRKHDLIFVTSNKDKIKLDNDIPEIPKYVLPNGVDMEYFHPLPYIMEPNTIVFTGMMGHAPNNDAMIYFIDEILPLIRKIIPGVKLYIVGKRPTRNLKLRASENIMITGYVDDVRPYIWRSCVYVVPMRMGGGTRLKVLEALAMKKPVVSTSIGCEGISVIDNETIRIADEPDKFAELVIKILKDRVRSDVIIRNGYELVREYYDWKIIGEKMQEKYYSFFDNSDNIQEKSINTGK